MGREKIHQTEPSWSDDEEQTDPHPIITQGETNPGSCPRIGSLIDFTLPLGGGAMYSQDEGQAQVCYPSICILLHSIF